jgi:hypothetical protein
MALPNISLKFVDAYRDRMQLIQQAAHDEMQLYINQYGIEDGQALSEAAQGIVTKYSTMATSAAANMYDDLANYQGAGAWGAETIEPPTMKETQHAVFASLNGGTPDRAANAVESLVKQIGEDTILQNAVRDRAEYAWIPGGSETCAYCLDIASNGWQPARLDTAHGEHADHIHPNCKCHFMVRFSKEYDVEGYEPEKYKKILARTPGNTLYEKSNALERIHHADEQRRKIGGPSLEELLLRAEQMENVDGNWGVIVRRIANGDYSLKYKHQKYLQHVKGTVQYNQTVRQRGREQSFFTISEDEVQAYTFKYAGLGYTGADSADKVESFEFVTLERTIGKYFEKGEWHETKRIKIIYSKYGVHAVPVKEI